MDVAVRPCSRKPIEDVIGLADIVDLVEGDHDSPTECVEFLVDDVEDSCLGVTGGADAVLSLTNRTLAWMDTPTTVSSIWRGSR